MLNDAQARAYIQGEEPFDPVEWENKHVLMLVKVCREQTAKEMSEEFRANFKRTVSHWIELHKYCEYIKLLEREFEII